MQLVGAKLSNLQRPTILGVWWELQEFVLGGWELVDSETVHLSHTGKCPHGSPAGMGSPPDTADIHYSKERHSPYTTHVRYSKHRHSNNITHLEFLSNDFKSH